MGFYVQDDYWDALRDQPRKVRGDVLDAMCEFYFDGVEPTFTGVRKSLFTLMRERILIARKRSHAGSIKRESKRNQNGIKSESNEHQNDDQKRIKSESNEHQNDDQREIKSESLLLKSESESESEKNISKEKGKESAAFSPPSLGELEEYAAGRGWRNFDAQSFIDYYGAQGWRLSNGNEMKNWKCAAGRWNRTDGGEGYVDEEFSAYFHRP